MKRFAIVMEILNDVRLLLTCAVQLDRQDQLAPADQRRGDGDAQARRALLAQAYVRIRANLDQLLEACK